VDLITLPQTKLTHLVEIKQTPWGN